MKLWFCQYWSVKPFINIIPQIRTIEINDRNALIERNLGCFNCAFVMRESDMFEDIAYSNSLLSNYGSWMYNATIKISKESDIDGTLIKLLLVILAVSTCSDIVFF